MPPTIPSVRSTSPRLMTPEPMPVPSVMHTTLSNPARLVPPLADGVDPGVVVDPAGHVERGRDPGSDVDPVDVGDLAVEHQHPPRVGIDHAVNAIPAPRIAEPGGSCRSRSWPIAIIRSISTDAPR